MHASTQVDEELGAERLAHEMGTTAVVALLSARHLWVANCGDSRAVLCRTDGAVAMSSDHKATRNDEVVSEIRVTWDVGDRCDVTGVSQMVMWWV